MRTGHGAHPFGVAFGVPKFAPGEFVLGVLALMVCAAGAFAGDADSVAAPDTILHHGKIVTVNPSFDIAEAVAIEGDRIVAVGRDADIEPLSGAATRMIDLEGQTVVPGLIDSHIHAFGYGLHITKHVMFSTGERLTVKSMLNRIAERVKQTPSGEWIYARGPYSLDFIAEGRLPSRRELDAVAPDNPFFMNMQGHVGVVNSYAIRVAGLTADAPDPVNGMFVRDGETGEFTGTLYEFPAFVPFLKHIPPYPATDLEEAVRAANRKFIALGLTSVVNLWMSESELEVLQKLAREDQMSVRWATMLKVDPGIALNKTPEEIEAAVAAVARRVRTDDDWLTVNGIKIIYDGFAEAAAMHEPYLEHVFGKSWRGIAFWDRENLLAVLQASATHGLQVSVHVAGDAALDTVLDLMEAVHRVQPITKRRWTLEHAGTIPTAAHLEAARRMGIVISTQQSMGWSIGKTFKAYWGEERGAAFAPNRSWLEGVGHPYLKAGSDNRPVNPFIGIWAYITRQDVDGVVSMAEESLDRDDVLRLYTINGAFGMFQERTKGSIEPGKLADLVVLSDDLMSLPADRIRHMKPVMTMVGGRFEYIDDGSFPAAAGGESPGKGR